MTLERHFVNDGHSHHFLVTHDVTGWNTREEEDAIVIRESHHRDWHRVEGAIRRFELSAVALEKDGRTESSLRRGQN